MTTLRILIVDDDAVDRTAVRRALAGSEIEASVMEAEDSMAATQMLFELRFDCVLLDYNLPRTDGLAALKGFKEIDCHLPVIMLTGQGDENLAVQLMKAGAADYIPKTSLSPQRLVTAILGAVRLRDAQTAAAHTQEVLRRQVQFSELFVGVVSHDLRNPLNVVLLNALLLRRAELEPPLQRAVERIESSGQMAIRLIRDLLDLTQARLGPGMKITRAPGHAASIVQRTIEELRQAHPDRVIAAELSEDGFGSWDADRLIQLVTNLVSNAVAYGDADSPVTVRLVGDPEKIFVSVHNQGAPIGPELMPELFEPFRQGSGEGRVERNIGLGLFIVRQIALAHGGQVRCESTLMEGTTFTVQLLRQGIA